MSSHTGSAGAGRDGKLRELLESIRESADFIRVTGDSDDVITSGRSILADVRQIDAILAVPDPLASDTGQEAVFGSMDRLIVMARCEHANRAGGNDYIECADCGLMWDYRKESPNDGIVNFLKLHPVSAPLASSSETQGELESLAATIAKLKAGADRIAGPGPDTLEILWRGKSIAYETILGCISKMRREPPSSVPVRASGAQETAIRLAKEATNGWACYAKRKVEHVEIARLHREINAAVRASGEPQKAKRFSENETKDVLTALYQDGHVDLVLADRIAALMASASPSDDGARQPQQELSIGEANALLRGIADIEAGRTVPLPAAASDDGAAREPGLDLEPIKAWRAAVRRVRELAQNPIPDYIKNGGPEALEVEFHQRLTQTRGFNEWDVIDTLLAEVERQRARIVVLETSVDSLRYLIDHPVTPPEPQPRTGELINAAKR